MLRLYFLVPDDETTVRIASELNDMGLRKGEVHVLAEDQARLESMGVNRATFLQTSDVVNATKRGLIIGIPLGILLGAIAAFFLPVEWSMGELIALLVGTGIFGAFFGSWASSMVGVSVLDVKVAKFQKEIRRGAFLMLVDVPPRRETEIVEAVKAHHPEVAIEKITPRDNHRTGGEGA